jgi:DNA-directed RNA polymerase subunit RPC12/RpoP
MTDNCAACGKECNQVELDHFGGVCEECSRRRANPEPPAYTGVCGVHGRVTVYNVRSHSAQGVDSGWRCVQCGARTTDNGPGAE